MARPRYCSAEDVRRYLPRNIVVEGENASPNPRNPRPETLDIDTINEFIEDACDYIDTEIGTIYNVPLQKTNIGGSVQYPPPIPSIAARLAAKFIFEQRLSSSDTQQGEFINNHYNQALRELNGVVTGTRRLIGQLGQMGNRFTRSAWHGIPPMPSREPPDRV